MNYDINKIENEFNIKLDSTQKEVLSSLICFIESNEHTICVEAKSGCGKTTLFKILSFILHQNDINYILVAPTNKAASLYNWNVNASTIHSLLGLQPNLDIMDFRADALEFKSVKKIYNYDVILIDECSMINDSLYNTLYNKFKNSKLIFAGDPKQLAPVNQNHISKTFDTKKLILTKVYRQTEGKLYKVLEYLRNKPLYKFKNVTDDNGNIIVYDNIQNMFDDYSYLFKLSKDLEDINLVKMVTYTNNRVSALNNFIRSKIYSDKEEYHEGELLTGYDTNRWTSVENSRDYIIVKLQPFLYKHPRINEFKFNAYNVILENTNSRINTVLLSRDNPQSYFNLLAQEIEHIRKLAVTTKIQRNWDAYFESTNFLTPIDLCYDNRVIKRKSIDYGYCISAHKSQGSTYNIVIVDMVNLLRCKNKEELRQLQYVACSRTSGDLIIYQK